MVYRILHQNDSLQCGIVVSRHLLAVWHIVELSLQAVHLILDRLRWKYRNSRHRTTEESDACGAMKVTFSSLSMMDMLLWTLKEPKAELDVPITETMFEAFLKLTYEGVVHVWQRKWQQQQQYNVFFTRRRAIITSDQWMGNNKEHMIYWGSNPGSWHPVPETMTTSLLKNLYENVKILPLLMIRLFRWCLRCDF